MPPTDTDPARPAPSRPLLWALGIGVCVITALVLWDARVGRERGVAPIAMAPLPAPTAPPAAAPVTPGAPATGPAPSFDIVRINPRGDAVMAGRATPGAGLTIRDGSRDLGHARADTQGNWVFLPSEPLQPGARELAVVEVRPGGQERRSEGSVLLVVPEAGASPANAGPLAVLSTPGAAPRMLQGPQPTAEPTAPATVRPPTGGATPSRPASGLGLDVVDYDERGEIRFAGTAPPGANLRLYVDNQPVGDATADPVGRWTMAPAAPVVAGEHRLRLDQLAAGGQVSQRVELPFRRETRAPAAGDGRIVVQPGQSLWVLARQVYGQGTRYTVIYAANREQIRDPRLIFPGQTFALPAAEPAAPR